MKTIILFFALLGMIMLNNCCDYEYSHYEIKVTYLNGDIDTIIYEGYRRETIRIDNNKIHEPCLCAGYPPGGEIIVCGVRRYEIINQ